MVAEREFQESTVDEKDEVHDISCTLSTRLRRPPSIALPPPNLSLVAFLQQEREVLPSFAFLLLTEMAQLSAATCKAAVCRLMLAAPDLTIV